MSSQASTRPAAGSPHISTSISKMNAEANPPDPERPRAVAYLVITAFCWSLGGLLIKLVDWNPMAIAGTRSAIAAVVLLVVIRRPRFTWSRNQIAAAFFYAATVILFVAATKMTTAANAIVLQYTAPVYVALLGGWFLGERPKLLDWLTIAAAVCGMVLSFMDGLTTEGYWGNAFAIISGITFAWFVLFMRRQKHGSPIESVLLGNLFAAAVCVPFMLGKFPNARGWVGLGLLGVIQMGLPYVFYSKAIKHVTAIEATLIPIFEPVLNPVWVLLLTGEAPGFHSLLGGVIVIGSVVVRGLAGIDRPKPKK
jgi:drug/metabolite transporter (DMT)-like permease